VPSSTPEISVVVPLFNEAENLGELHRRLSLALESLGSSYELVFVNDGSRDATGDLLDELRRADPQLVVLHLSRNFGHQAAICAGIDHARGEAVVLMDGDLQDPPEVLDQFILAWREGHEVVYAVRTQRQEAWPKRCAYALFYRVWRAVGDIEIPLDSGDFCLLDRKVVEVLKHLPERQRFVRGLRSFVGFRQVGVRYARAARAAGEPKYTWPALLRLALDGLIGFSGFPLNLVTYVGLAVGALAVALTVALLATGWRQGMAPAGWLWAVLAVLFVGALQIFSVGIVGEYVRRIFLEVKGRPTYLVDRVCRPALTPAVQPASWRLPVAGARERE
jgi:glycosyltransferase involved in cell wall biosynthesis